jgi:hypothetical protein
LRKKLACPAVQSKFRRQVNMTSDEIRRWAADPRAKCASFKETVQRLTQPQMWKGKMRPSLATLRAKRPDAWTETDCEYAVRVNSFNSRMQGMVDKWGCKPRALLSLRNWGRMPPKCSMEVLDALGKDCRRRRRKVRRA